MTKLKFLGACREVGRSSVMIQEKGLNVVMDCGLKVHGEQEFPTLDQNGFDEMIISHAHLDHTGAIPVGNARQKPLYMTDISLPITELLLADSEKVAIKRNIKSHYGEKEISRALGKIKPMKYEKEHVFKNGSSFAFLDAGHIPGSAGVMYQGEKKIFYTGDFKMVETRLHEGAIVPNNVEVMITESTYATKEQPDRVQLEKKFVDSVKEALTKGPAIIAAFATGRTQELIQILRYGGIEQEIIVDGMGGKINDIIMNYPGYIKDQKFFTKCMQTVETITNRRFRKTVVKQNKLVICTAGMLDGGPVLEFIKQMREQGKGKLFMTGFQAEETNGRRILQEKEILLDGTVYKVNFPYEQYEFSAHPSKSELMDAIKKANPQKVFCMHGDDLSCTTFAKELNDYGYEAYAPTLGQEFEL